MAQVAAGREVETEHPVSGADQRKEHGKIGLTAGVRLHVCVCAVEQLACALDRRLLDHVDVAPAGVIAGAGVSFQRLVRHRVTECVEHGAANGVLGGDELDLLLLASPFAGQCLGDQRVSLSDALVHVPDALGAQGSCRSGASG